MTDQATGVAAPAAGGQGQGNVTNQQQSGQINQAQPQQGAQTQGQQGQQTAQPKEVVVPLHVVEAIRKELSESKVAAGDLRSKLQQFEMMQQMGGFNQPQTQQTQQIGNQGAQSAPQTTDPLSGLQDDDLVSVKELRSIVKGMGAPDLGKVLDPINATLARVQVQLQDPNFEQTIRTYLPEMITANPYVREMIIRAPNPLLAALGVARMSPRFVQAQQAASGEQGVQAQQRPPDILSDLQKIIENATRPGSPGYQGGSGAISGADRFRNMNDADFDAEVNRVLQGQRR